MTTETTTTTSTPTETSTPSTTRPSSRARRRLRFADLRHLVKVTAATSGARARAALLAYAYARGMPYRRVEPVTRQAKEYAACPSEAWRAELHAAWRKHLAARVVAELIGNAPADCRVAIDQASVAAWLAVPETDAQ